MWLPGARRTRQRAEEWTDILPLLKDVWTKLRIVQSHGAAQASLLSTINTELAHQRYATERLADQIREWRAETAPKGGAS